MFYFTDGRSDSDRSEKSHEIELPCDTTEKRGYSHTGPDGLMVFIVAWPFYSPDTPLCNLREREQEAPGSVSVNGDA